MVQRERIAGVDAMTGGRIPRVAHIVAREAHREKGRIWREDRVREQRAVIGSSKLNCPNRFVRPSSKGMMSAQAIYMVGSGITGG